MADKVREWTDKKLSRMEKEISKQYKQAEKELTQKWNDYMKSGESKLSALENAYSEALKSGDNKNISNAKKTLQDAKKSFTLQNDQFKDVVDSVTMDMAKINQMALNYVNGQLPIIYAENYQQVKEVIDNIGISYTLTDKNTIIKLVEQGKSKTPFMNSPKYLKIPKDQRWNTKKINSSVLQGILQGEPMDKIAKRLLPIVDNNKASAIRNARTLVTGAENSGRMDSYHELEEQGIILKKVWIATSDDRTREWHLEMDGQEVDIDENFIDGLGNELEYPGDPDGEPETVYNCRCSMKAEVVGFK